MLSNDITSWVRGTGQRGMVTAVSAIVLAVCNVRSRWLCHVGRGFP